MILQGHCIDAARIERGDDRFLADVAEQRDLGSFAVGQRFFATAQQQVRLDAQPRHLAHRMLRGLGLQLARSCDVGHQRHVYGAGVLAAQLVAQLAQRLDERQALNVAHRAADLAQHEIEPIGVGLRELLDRIGDMRDDLDRRAEIIAAPFLGDDVAIDAARRDVVALMRGHTGEPFVVPQVEVGLGAVVGHVDFPVLIGAHRSGIDVEIGIELADADAKAARLQQRREARRHQTFAKRGDHAAGDKDIPRHGSWALSVCVVVGQASWCGRSPQSTTGSSNRSSG